MFLLIIINVVCCSFAFCHLIAKFLSIGKHISKCSPQTELALEGAIANAKLQLETLKTTSSPNDYKTVVETMRAERKVEDIEKQLKDMRKMCAVKGASIDLMVGYILKAVLSLILVIISICYRYTPVIVFDDRFNFAPFGGIISFPTSIPNAISVPVWVLSSNAAFGLISRYVNGK